MIRRGLKFSGLAGAILVVWTTAGPALAQSLGLAHDPDISLWRVAGALLFCCLLGAGGALALKYRLQGKKIPQRSFDTGALGQWLARIGRTSPEPDGSPERLKVIATVRLSYQVDVSLLECDGTPLVIVTSPHGAFIANSNAPTKSGDA